MTFPRTIKATLLAFTFLVPAITPAFAFEAGTRWMTITAPDHKEAERVLITYPALADGDAYTLGGDQLWTGVPARRNATPVAEKFPLVILSHGSGGNAAALGWLSAELARNGFIVAAPNHIHSTSGDSIPADSIRIWERSHDVSALIDRMTSDADWAPIVDKDRIGGIGFSLGGVTMMLSAGARASLPRFAAFCDDPQNADAGCGWFKRGGVDFAKIDAGAFEGDYRDRRLAAVVTVDPGLAMAYQEDSLAAIHMPMLFVNLGTGEQIMRGVRAQALAGQIAGAGYAAIPDAIHFSFLGICNPGGAELLKRYGEEDPICADGGTTPREELHKQIFFQIAVFLRRELAER
jgi:predicted dienelactone hydrolase